MKKFKKFASLLLALVMVCAMSVTAFATTSTDDGTGSITINNATVDETYTIYQMATVTYNTATNAYVYTATNDWESFFNSADVADYITCDSSTNIITWKGEETAARTSAFATLALNYAKSLTSNQGSTKATSNTVSFSNLSLGWYLVDSSLGTVCSITTTNPSVTIQDKNQTPGTDLKKEASDTKAQIGDTVTYTITSSVPAYDGVTKITEYKFVDTLSAGLTAPTSVTVEIKDSSKTVIATNDISSTAYSSAISVSIAGQVITVSYNPENITNYPADATIEIKYTATVNAEAAYENGNSVTQTWTGDSTGKTETETVHTYGFNLQKVDGTDKTTQLTGAKFKLYTSETGGEAITFSYADGVYTVDPDGDVTEIEAGYATIFGLDADVTYYLEETQAPDGYNVLKDRVSVTVTTTGTSEVEGILTITQTEKVENNSGTSLPGTGGIGTTIFYVVGTVMVLGAVVVLITRKRMSA